MKNQNKQLKTDHRLAKRQFARHFEHCEYSEILGKIGESTMGGINARHRGMLSLFSVGVAFGDVHLTGRKVHPWPRVRYQPRLLFTPT
jgi:hypothetical protein